MGMVSTNGQQTKVEILKVSSSRHSLGTLTVREALHWFEDIEIKEVASAFKELTIWSLRKIIAC